MVQISRFVNFRRKPTFDSVWELDIKENHPEEQRSLSILKL